MAAPRAQIRAEFDDVVRLRLLENDADDAEAHGIALQAQLVNELRDLRAWVTTELADFREEINGIKKLLVGILVSVTTACILLVVNIVVVAGGGG